jgi:hypothetical protein
MRLALLALLPASFALPQAPAASCSPLELLIGKYTFHKRSTAMTNSYLLARGTTEPPNPDFGIVVGDPIYEATKEIIPGVTGYAVNYPASFEKDSKTKGTADVLKRLESASVACPKQEFVLVGYSQGGDVMHDAAAKLSKNLYEKIVAVVLFGDPGNRGV